MFVCLLQLLGTSVSILFSLLGPIYLRVIYLIVIIVLLFLKGKISKNSQLYVGENKIKILLNNVGGKKEKR